MWTPSASAARSCTPRRVANVARKKKHGFSVKVKFPTMPQAIAKLGADRNGSVQELVTEEVYKNLPDFMPRRKGELIGSMEIIAPNMIKVASQHAKSMFFGNAMKAPGNQGPFPVGDGEFRFRKGAHSVKSGKPIDYSKSTTPHPGPHWDRRMVAARGKAIVKKVNKYVRRKGIV